jgi:putative endonuclease
MEDAAMRQVVPKEELGRGGVPRGAWGEEAAVAHVLAHGGRIVARNFRCKAGEIDLIAEVERVLVFGEVKARRNRAFGGGREAVGWKKRMRIFRTALRWCSQHGLDHDRVAMRFDVFEVAPGPVVTWLRGAFDAEGLPVG